MQRLVSYRPLAPNLDRIVFSVTSPVYSFLDAKHYNSPSRRRRAARRYSPPLPKPASTKKLNAMSPKPTNVSVVGSPFRSSLKLMPSTSYSGCSGISNLRLPSSFDDERSAVDDGTAGRRKAFVQVLNGATATGWRSAGIDARKPSLHPSSVRATQSCNLMVHVFVARCTCYRWNRVAVHSSNQSLDQSWRL